MLAISTGFRAVLIESSAAALFACKKANSAAAITPAMIFEIKFLIAYEL